LCVCVRARARACVRERGAFGFCVCVCARARVCVRERGASSSLLLIKLYVCVSISLSHTSPLQALRVWKLDLQQKWLTMVAVVLLLLQ